MSTFGVDGLASGLDTTSIVNQLMALERQPQTQLKSRLSDQEKAITAYQSVSSRVSSITSALDALTSEAAWGARTATVTGDSVKATASPGAPLASFSVNVTRLATPQSALSDASHALDDVLVATEPPIQIDPGDGGAPVTLNPPTGTMNELIDEINKAARLGVTAVAIRTGENQYRLQIVSNTPGSAGAAKADATIAAIAAAWSGAGGLTSATAPADLATLDAEYSINNLPAVTSPSNTVTDAVSGVSLTLTAQGTSTVRVTDDAAFLATKMETLVNALNVTLEEVASQTIRDASVTTRGPLASDSQVRNLATSILAAVTDAVGGKSPASFGLQIDRSGRVTFDKAAFTSAYQADPAGIRELVAPTADGASGIATRLAGIADQATDSTTGFLTLAVQGRESTKADLQERIDNWDIRLDYRQSTLQRQFTAMETALSRLQSQQSWLSQQITSLNAQTAAN